MLIRFFLISILSMALWGCSHHSDPRLLRLEQMASANDDSARIALDSLQAIDPAQLPEADRHFYDFLSVKIADKAYVRHSSDSLILSVISYEEANQGYGRYPEALYYGGRVYSDLGDSPTALQYFQQALDELPEDADANLKGRILSQTARLFNSLRLYDQAIRHLEEAISVETLNKDSIDLMYNTHLLGIIYFHQDKYDEAEACFYKARNLAEKVSPIDIYQQDLYLAEIKHQKGQLDSALYLIRPVMENIHKLDRHVALAMASNIYLEKNILDTAWMYSQELIHNKNTYNRITGYKIALSDGLRNYLHKDSISSYISAYRTLVNKYLKHNSSRETLMQNSLYNYRLHERERSKAEISNERLRYWIILVSMIVLLLTAIILYLKNRNKNNVIRLHAALENITMLEQSLRQASGNKPDNAEKKELVPSPTPVDSKDNAQVIRERLKSKLMSLYLSNETNNEVSHLILQSDSYRELLDAIACKKEIEEGSKLWLELESDIIKSSPNFKSNLQLLLGGKLSPLDLHTAILVKCGITPMQMSIVFNRTKGTIVSRRESICKKIYGENFGTKVIDGIIRLL